TCIEVAAYLLEQCRANQCALDLRLLNNAYADYRLWAADQSACHWHDLVATRTREAATHFRHEIDARPDEEKKAERRNILRAVMKETPSHKEQERLYRERTGKGESDFDRRLREVRSGDFDSEAEE